MKAEYKRRLDKVEVKAIPPEIPTITVIWRFVEAKDGRPTGRYLDRYPDGTEIEGDGYTVGAESQ